MRYVLAQDLQCLYKINDDVFTIHRLEIAGVNYICREWTGYL